MTWIQTISGKAFYPLFPQIEAICIEDIAHALAMKCRFTGHCKRFYSIAEHSCLCAAQANHRFGRKAALHLLLHDCAEAYLPDVAGPIKHLVSIDGYGFDLVEAVIVQRVYEALGLTLPDADEQDIIKLIDLELLATEKRDLLAEAPQPWIELPDPLPLSLVFGPAEYENFRVLFLADFYDLS